jgi:hypothetical protein
MEEIGWQARFSDLTEARVLTLIEVAVGGFQDATHAMAADADAEVPTRMRGRLVLNGSAEIRGSLGEISGTHLSEATALWLQTMVPLNSGDTVELQGTFRVTDGYFAADHTSFWGAKVG